MARKRGIGRQTKKDALKQYLNEEATKRLRPHDMILSEHSLAERFSVSRVTVRSAVRELSDEGLLYARHGKGTFVAGRRRKTPVALIHELKPDVLGWKGFYPSFFGWLARLANQDGHEFQIYGLDTPLRPLPVDFGQYDLPPWDACGNPVLVDKLAEGALGGVIFCLAPYRNIGEVVGALPVPHVALWGPWAPPAGMNCVGVDNRSDQLMALDYLLDRGCGRILDARMAIDALRELRARAARRGAGLTFTQELKGLDPKDFDGLMVGDDYFAMENLSWLHAFGDYGRLVLRVNGSDPFPLPVVRLETRTQRFAETVWAHLRRQIENGAPAPGVERIPSALKIHPETKT